MSRSRKRIQQRKQQQAQQRKRLMAALIAVAGLVVVGVAALLVTRSGSPAGYTPQASGPRLRLAQDVYDYGYVKLDTVITTDVEIQNVGDEPLKISEVPVVEVREGC